MDNYESNIVLTYTYYDPKLRERFHKNDKFNIEDVADMEDMRDFIYQSELMRTFNISTPDELSIDIFDQLEASLVSTSFLHVINKMEPICHLNNLSFDHIMPLLFSYDYFFLTHQCIQSLKHDNMRNIDQNTLDKMLNYIDSNLKK